MIIYDKTKDAIEKFFSNCEYCQKCIETRKCTCIQNEINNRILNCHCGYSYICLDEKVLCGAVVDGFSNLKKINGHLRQYKLPIKYTIYEPNDIIVIFSIFSKESEVKQFSDKKRNFDVYRNTVHSIKNTIRTINSFTGNSNYMEDDIDLKQYNFDLNAGFDLIRTILDYHEESVYGKNKLATSNYFATLKLHKSILKLIKILDYEARLKGVKFKISGNPQNTIYNYSKKIYIMLFIVLENAIKYSTENSRVEIKIDDLDDDKVSICVKNWTTPISEYDIEHILEREYRGSNSKGKEGTGLGMSILKDLADSTGTEIKIEHENNERFLITLIFNSLYE